MTTTLTPRALPVEPARGAPLASSPIRDLLDQARRPGILNLAGGIPATELLPLDDVAGATARVLREAGPAALQYGPTRGEPALLDQLALLSGTDPGSLLVTTGSQQALDLLARSFLGPGEAVAVEDPCYVGARNAFAATGAEVLGVPVDGHGLDTEALERLLRRRRSRRVRICYVNASFQNPTGVTLSAERWAHLLRLAERHGFLVVDDDPYGALAYDGEPRRPAHPHPNVVRLRSASKLVAPGLRIGWVSGDPGVVDGLVLRKQGVDLHSPTLGQLVLADLLGRPGWLAGLGARARTAYRARRDALLAGLDHHLGGMATYRRPGGGLFVWLTVDGRGTGSELAAAAIGEGVAVVPGEAFTVEPPRRPAVRLSFSSLPPDRMDDAALRLSRATVRWRDGRL